MYICLAPMVTMVQQVPYKRKETQGLTNDGGEDGEGFPSPFFPPAGHLSKHQQSTPKRGRNLVQVSKLRPLFGAQLGIYERRLRRWGERSREGNGPTPTAVRPGYADSTPRAAGDSDRGSRHQG